MLNSSPLRGNRTPTARRREVAPRRSAPASSARLSARASRAGGHACRRHSVRTASARRSARPRGEREPRQRPGSSGVRWAGHDSSPCGRRHALQFAARCGPSSGLMLPGSHTHSPHSARVSRSNARELVAVVRALSALAVGEHGPTSPALSIAPGSPARGRSGVVAGLRTCPNDSYSSRAFRPADARAVGEVGVRTRQPSSRSRARTRAANCSACSSTHGEPVADRHGTRTTPGVRGSRSPAWSALRRALAVAARWATTTRAHLLEARARISWRLDAAADRRGRDLRPGGRRWCDFPVTADRVQHQQPAAHGARVVPGHCVSTGAAPSNCAR